MTEQKIDNIGWNWQLSAAPPNKVLLVQANGEDIFALYDPTWGKGRGAWFNYKNQIVTKVWCWQENLVIYLWQKTPPFHRDKLIAMLRDMNGDGDFVVQAKALLLMVTEVKFKWRATRGSPEGIITQDFDSFEAGNAQLHEWVRHDSYYSDLALEINKLSKSGGSVEWINGRVLLEKVYVG